MRALVWLFFLALAAALLAQEPQTEPAQGQPGEEEGLWMPEGYRLLSFEERKAPGCFLQASLTELPFTPNTFDLILSEGVLHHTDSTRGAFEAMVKLLKPGGRFMFYVYRRKGPIREFTDDYIREKMQKMGPEEAWKALMPGIPLIRPSTF